MLDYTEMIYAIMSLLAAVEVFRDGDSSRSVVLV